MDSPSQTDPQPRGMHPAVVGLGGLALLALVFVAAWLSSTPGPPPSPSSGPSASPTPPPSETPSKPPSATPAPLQATPRATSTPAAVHPPPLTASTPIPLGTPRPPWVPPLPEPTWGRYVPDDPAYQVEPPSLLLDGPEEPTLAESVKEPYPEALRLLGLGKDGTLLLERAANEGHLEAAFLAWLWRPNPETGKRLALLMGPEARPRLVRSFKGGLPRALWLPVSSKWVRAQQEERYGHLTSGNAERVRSALPSSLPSADKAKLFEFYVNRRPRDLQILVERVETPQVRAQTLELEGEELYLRTRLSVEVGTRRVYTQDGQRADQPSTNEVQLNLRLPLEPLGDW